MKTRFTNIFKSILVLCSVAFLFTTLNAEPVKRVVLEQHTGAWCGWCVDGTYMGDLLKEKYPETFIVVKNHNGDGMVQSYEVEIAKTFGLTGYPNGMVDRRIVGQAVMLGRGSWTQAAEAALKLAPQADITATVSISGQTMTINVEAEALVDVTKQWAFNVYVCEDYVTGTGSGFDQANYLSGRAGYETNPYYTKPAKIVGYEHMAVTRALLGGSLGDVSKFTTKDIKKGDKFSQTFTYQIPAGYNTKNMYAVAFIQEREVSGTSLTAFSIVNAIEVGKKPAAKPITMKATVANSYNTATPNVNKTFDITVKNENAKEYAVKFEIDNTASSIPAGWTVKLQNSSESLGAKGQFTLPLDVKPNANQAGFAKIAVKVTPQPADPAERGEATMVLVYVLSDNAKNLVLTGLSDGAPAFANILTADATKGKATVTVAFDENMLKAYPASMFDMIGLQLNYFNVPLLTYNAAVCATTRAYLTSMINSGKKIFITGEGVASQLGTANDDATAASFVNSLGIAKNGNPTLSVSVNSQGQITGYLQKKLKGTSGNFADGTDLTVNTDSTDATKISIALDNIKTMGNAKMLIDHVNDAGAFVHANSITNEIGNTRLVYLGHLFESINSNQKDKLGKNIIAYLWGEATKVGPKAVLSTNKLDFGNVKKGEKSSKEVTIKNEGDEDFTIYSVMLENDSKSVYNMTSGAAYTVVKVGETHKINVEFSPKEDDKTYTAKITVNTNINGSTDYTINLEGESSTVSVKDGIAGNSEVFTMFAGPNPFAVSSVLNYNLSGDVSKNIEITMIDMSGKTIGTLMNSVVAPGVGTIELNSANLTNGTYFIRANVEGYTTQLPVVIAK